MTAQASAGRAALLERAAQRLCPLCGGERWTRWRRRPLLRCVDCDLVVDPGLWKGLAHADQLTADYFTEGFIGRIDPWQRAFELANNRRTWRRLAPRVAPRASWLEIGVGSGSLMAYAASRGMRVSGCDASRAVCEYVRRRYGLPVTHGHVADLAAADRYDVVILNHVLEHVPDPVGMLREIRARLSPGGCLHVAVPNVGSWDARLPGWISYAPYHLVYFTHASLAQALAHAGFTAAPVGTFEPFSGWTLAVLGTLRGRATGSAGRPTQLTGAARHLCRLGMTAAGALLTPVRAVQARAGFGEELFVIARAV